ncbi:MAG: hypothetical protein S4CHLAM2_04450 [Chlamydiales bacterium]|nr:hypothetical protein [Chlamydiales bacterium]
MKKVIFTSCLALIPLYVMAQYGNSNSNAMNVNGNQQSTQQESAYQPEIIYPGDLLRYVQTQKSWAMRERDYAKKRQIEQEMSAYLSSYYQQYLNEQDPVRKQQMKEEIDRVVSAYGSQPELEPPQQRARERRERQAQPEPSIQDSVPEDPYYTY